MIQAITGNLNHAGKIGYTDVTVMSYPADIYIKFRIIDLYFIILFVRLASRCVACNEPTMVIINLRI